LVPEGKLVAVSFIAFSSSTRDFLLHINLAGLFVLLAGNGFTCVVRVPGGNPLGSVKNFEIAFYSARSRFLLFVRSLSENFESAGELLVLSSFWCCVLFRSLSD
jgi:hypothetical protein